MRLPCISQALSERVGICTSPGQFGAPVHTQVLACRLNQFIGGYIGLDQAGFVINRHLGDSIRLLIGLIEHVHDTKKPTVLFCRCL